MSSRWPRVTFGDIFEISSSKRVHERDWKPVGVPFYRAREIVALARDGYVHNDLYISEDLFREYEKHGVPAPDDLMISAVGTLGACYVVRPGDRFYYKDASVLRFRPRQTISTSFFKHAFRMPEILDQVNAGAGSTVGTYTIDRARQTQISLPPLPEQRRIAKILDKADALRAKRRAALAQLDTLTQSIFLDMFGDPARNAKGWPTARLADLCTRVTDGTHQPPKWSETGHPFLFVSNVITGELNFDTAKFISDETYNDLTRRCPIEVGDVLYSTVGSYGIPALVRTERKFAFQRHIAHLKPDRRLLDAGFLRAMLASGPLRRQADNVARGVAQKTVNLSDIREFLVFKPPLDVQRGFATRISRVDSLKRQHGSSLAQLDALFASLQHRAFRGEL